MLNGPAFKILAGLDVVELIRADRARTVRPAAGSWLNSDDLCQQQVRMARCGFIGAQIVKSMYGYSVRYDSGLQNWGILAGARMGTVDGSLEAAVAWATRWQAQDAAHRYVWMMEG